MTVHCLTHVPFEGPGAIEQWARARGHEFTLTPVYEGGALPELADAALLVVMGGPMSVGDEGEYPWLAGEKAYLRQALADTAVPVIGICLGAQLLADVLGARVYPNGQKEIGAYPVTLTEAGRTHPLTRHFPPSLEVFHWHGDTFTLPDGAEHLLRSEVCAHQGFAWSGRAVGLQFHMEMTGEGIARLVDACGAELVDGPTIATREAILAAPPPATAPLLFALLDRLTG